jgi:hemolysin III
MLFRPKADELLNSLTHGIGFLLSVVGAVVLIGQVVTHGDAWRCTGCGIYAVALMGVYACSTLSHSTTEPEMKRWFRILDQAFIYLLIVGTYTPFALAYLRTTGWLTFLAAMWAIAILGFLSKLLLAHRVDAVAVWIYVALGWMPLVAAIPLVDIAPIFALWWMFAGGLCYTLGTAFLMNDHRVPRFHAIWHLMVIAGSAFHFFAILHAVAWVA